MVLHLPFHGLGLNSPSCFVFFISPYQQSYQNTFWLIETTKSHKMLCIIFLLYENISKCIIQLFFFCHFLSYIYIDILILNIERKTFVFAALGSGNMALQTTLHLLLFNAILCILTASYWRAPNLQQPISGCVSQNPKKPACIHI